MKALLMHPDRDFDAKPPSPKTPIQSAQDAFTSGKESPVSRREADDSCCVVSARRENVGKNHRQISCRRYQECRANLARALTYDLRRLSWNSLPWSFWMSGR